MPNGSWTLSGFLWTKVSRLKSIAYTIGTYYAFVCFSSRQKIDSLVLTIKITNMILDKNDDKDRTFWETHKIWKKFPHGFDKSADLLSKRQKHEEDFFKLCVLLKKSEL